MSQHVPVCLEWFRMIWNDSDWLIMFLAPTKRRDCLVVVPVRLAPLVRHPAVLRSLVRDGHHVATHSVALRTDLPRRAPRPGHRLRPIAVAPRRGPNPVCDGPCLCDLEFRFRMI